MRRNKNQITTTFIICSLLLIGVIYAILQANLQINGTAKIQGNTWDIHFDNIQVNENSVSIGNDDSAATIDPENNCKVDFEVTLSIPGDFYEFTIDVVNAGTIDGMIGTLNKTLKVNNEVVSEVPNYLDYSVTYSDGVEIEENHKITAGTTETYLVRLEFKTDIEELPEATTITTSLEPQYLQADSSASPPLHYHSLYDVFKTEVDNNSGLVHEYTGEHKDSFTINGNEKIYYWYSKYGSYSKVDIIKEKMNVIFGGFCWKMFRTTDTGGIKLLYNGIPSEGSCHSTGDNTAIGKSSFNAEIGALAHAGYMYNPDTLKISITDTNSTNSLYGQDVDYNNGTYTLINTSTTRDGSHHYSCKNTTGSCSKVRFYYGSYVTYFELDDGRDINDLINDMLYADNTNKTNSTAKSYVDTWYQDNLLELTDRLEDTIFCNNRTIGDLGSWALDSSNLDKDLKFKNYKSDEDLSCPHITDQFCLANAKAQLIYPIGLLTSNEMKIQYNTNILGETDSWTMTPSYYHHFGRMNSLYYSSSNISEFPSSAETNIRPVVSLKPGTMYQIGDGSTDNPYIIN